MYKFNFRNHLNIVISLFFYSIPNNNLIFIGQQLVAMSIHTMFSEFPYFKINSQAIATNHVYTTRRCCPSDLMLYRTHVHLTQHDENIATAPTNIASSASLNIELQLSKLQFICWLNFFFTTKAILILFHSLSFTPLTMYPLKCHHIFENRSNFEPYANSPAAP